MGKSLTTRQYWDKVAMRISSGETVDDIAEALALKPDQIRRILEQPDFGKLFQASLKERAFALLPKVLNALEDQLSLTGSTSAEWVRQGAARILLQSLGEPLKDGADGAIRIELVGAPDLGIAKPLVLEGCVSDADLAAVLPPA